MFIKESSNGRLYYAMDDTNKIVKIFTNKRECLVYLKEHNNKKRTKW